MDSLKFSSVNTEQSFRKFVEFANSFDHKEGDHTLLPAFTVARGDKQFGYFTVLTQPVICPALHPELTTPRDFLDTVNQVTAWRNINSISERFPNGTTFLALENKPAIDESIIQKLGFRNLGSRLWQQGGA